MVGVHWPRGNGGVQSDGEYIFGRPLSRLISSYVTLKVYTLSFPTFGLTCSGLHFVDPQLRVVSYLLTQFLWSLIQKCSLTSIPFGYGKRCSGVLMVGSLPSRSIVSAQQPRSGASPSSLNEHVQVLRQLCFTTICGQIDCMYIDRKT